MYKGKGGIQYTLSAKALAAGGEGEIFDITGQPNVVAKIYKPGKTSVEKERKLIRMVDFPPDKSVLSQIAWPQDVLYDSGKFVGFVMPKMSINEDLNVIYEYGASAKYPHMPWDNRLLIAQNLCAVLDSVHAVGHTVGDFNPKNISVNPQTGHIMFLDTDSYHITDGSDTLRCDVGMPEYLPAEIQIKMRGGGTLATAKLPTFAQDTDNFALAIHIFQLLMNGVHPFACAIIPSQSSVTAPQPHENISKGEFPFIQNIPGIKIPVYAPPISILPQEIQDLFERAFIDGYVNPSARPSAEEWHKAIGRLRGQLKTCNNVQHHQYYKALSSCPWCDVNNIFSQSFQPKSTLTQQTIKAPKYTPPPSRPTQANSSYTASNTSPSSYHTSAKKRMSAGAKVAIFALVIGVGALLTGMVSGWFDFGNGNNNQAQSYIELGMISEPTVPSPALGTAQPPVPAVIPEPTPAIAPSIKDLMFDSGVTHDTLSSLAPSAGTEHSVVMAGRTYQNVTVYRSGPGTQHHTRNRPMSAFTLHNLGGQYAQLSGRIGRVDGSGQLDATLRIYGDGNLLRTETLSATDMPTPIELSVEGISLLRIEVQFPSAPTNHRDPSAVYAFSGFVE